MEQFRLEEYLKDPARKVITKDGAKARIICTDRVHPAFPVVALVEGGYEGESAIYYTRDGRFIANAGSGYDLFFAPERREGWVNIRRTRYGATELAVLDGGTVYATREEAEAEREKAGTGDIRMYTCKIEWEE